MLEVVELELEVGVHYQSSTINSNKYGGNSEAVLVYVGVGQFAGQTSDTDPFEPESSSHPVKK